LANSKKGFKEKKKMLDEVFFGFSTKKRKEERKKTYKEYNLHEHPTQTSFQQDMMYMQKI